MAAIRVVTRFQDQDDVDFSTVTTNNLLAWNDTADRVYGTGSIVYDFATDKIGIGPGGTFNSTAYGTGHAVCYVSGGGGDYGQMYVFDSTHDEADGINSISGIEFGDAYGSRNATFGPLTSNTLDCMWGSRGGISFHTGASPSPHHGQNNIARGYIDTSGRWAIGGAIVDTDLGAGNYPSARLLVSNEISYSQDPITGVNSQLSVATWPVLSLRGNIAQTGPYLRNAKSDGTLLFQITSAQQFEWTNSSTGVVDTVLRRDAAGSLRTDTRLQVGTNLTVLAGTAAITTTLNAAYSATTAPAGDIVVKNARNTNGGMIGIEFVDSSSTRRDWIGFNYQSSGADFVVMGFNGSAYQEIVRVTKAGVLQLGGTTGPTLGFLIGTGTYLTAGNAIRMTVPTSAPVTGDMANGTLLITGNGTTQLTFHYKGTDGTIRTNVMTMS
jgi:hypothetical protein